MRPSYPFTPDHHQPGSLASTGRCSWHGGDSRTVESCQGDAVVSFQDSEGTWQSGCAAALEELVERGEIEPLGQGA
ncbi:hypothetical protein [Nocardioides sp. URHA0020]|uniref:hypothetical protein n=1 Tax=Nocardioides sp. URHA0020 TaxID=1380392 RepID=UPI00048DA821|nr:hypothetical protein [Nocardioides sp. URHA0020]